MTPREWVGCVVGVRWPDGIEGVATVRRAWRGARTGRLRRVALVCGAGRERAGTWAVRGVERRAHGPLRGLRVVLLGGRAA